MCRHDRNSGNPYHPTMLMFDEHTSILYSTYHICFVPNHCTEHFIFMLYIVQLVTVHSNIQYFSCACRSLLLTDVT